MTSPITPEAIAAALQGDPFDPRRFPLEPAHPELIIRLCNRDASLVARVSIEDYEWARRFTWFFCLSKQGLNRSEKFYAKTRVKTGPTRDERCLIFLHKAVTQRAHGDPPSRFHTIADHRDGNSLNCERGNLRWATPRINRMNIRGAYPDEG